MAHLYGRLLGKGLVYRLNSWTTGIEGETVAIFNLYTGAADTLTDVDTVVLARDRRPRTLVARRAIHLRRRFGALRRDLRHTLRRSFQLADRGYHQKTSLSCKAE
jgi:hypothetical protein